MGQKHKHHDLIVAWASGADIEYRLHKDLEWRLCKDNSPIWDELTEYRIKPEEKKPVETSYFYSDEEIKQYFINKCTKLYYTRTEFEE